METKKLIGYSRLAASAISNEVDTARKICKIANKEVIPLMQELGQSVTLEAVLKGVATREAIVTKAVEDTLASSEYAKQPQLIRNAVAEMRQKEVNNIALTYGVQTLENAHAARWCKLSISTSSAELIIDEEAIQEYSAVYAVGDKEIALLDAYNKAVDALNTLFPNGVPSSNRLAQILGSNIAGSGVQIRVDADHWAAIKVEAGLCKYW